MMSKRASTPVTRTKDEGTVLLTTLFACSILAILTAILTIMTEKYVLITEMHAASQRAYWLARSEALNIVVRIQQGASPVSFAVANDEGGMTSVAVDASNPSITEVRIVVTTQEAKNTITFSYDDATQKVLSWLANP